jgi:hypothetical protein
LTVSVENDLLTSSDNNYTNGVGITWVSADLDHYDPDSFVSKWSRFWKFLPFVLDEGYTTYAGWSLAQEIDTPDDILDPNPPQDDQPYAGILYLDTLFYARKERWAHVWQLKLGVVGPAAHADDVQKGVHDLIGADEPRGWHTQLPNEPVINIGYTASYLAAAGHAGGSAEWRILPVGTAGVGNYFTGAGLGIYGEVGCDLDAFGVTALRSGLNATSTVGVGPWMPGPYPSSAVLVRMVSRTFCRWMAQYSASRSADSKPAIGMACIGVCVRRGDSCPSLARLFHPCKQPETSDGVRNDELSWDL